MNLLKAKKKAVGGNVSSNSKNATSFSVDEELAPLEISVVEIKGDSCMAIDTHGEVVYDLVAKALKQNRPVKISYKDVDDVSAIFEKVAVGNLYKKFKAKKIEELIEIVDATELQEQLFAANIKRYRRYLKSPRKALKETYAILNGEF